MRGSKIELLEALEPFVQYEGRRILHVRSGNYYRIRDIFLREEDLTVRFTYADEKEQRLKFDRPIAELFDGRYNIESYESPRAKLLRLRQVNKRNREHYLSLTGRLSLDPL